MQTNTIVFLALFRKHFFLSLNLKNNETRSFVLSYVKIEYFILVFSKSF